MVKIGLTEYCDPVFDTSWEKWVLEKHEPTILITKNIKKLLETYPGLENQNNVILHATITGYGGSFIEPKVPKAQELLEYLKTKSTSRIVLRIDPIIPLEEFIKQSYNVYSFGKTIGIKRIRISIMDLYPHVLNRFNIYSNIQYQLKEVYNWDQSHSISGSHKEYMNHAPLSLREKIVNLFEGTEVCGEPGIKCQGCLSKKDLELFGIKPDIRYPKNEQREFCTCLGIKKQFGTLNEECAHSCLYCYKNI
jgi:DNA repair photolyase